MRKVIRQFRNGDISKEDYWNEMLEFHRVLEAYKEHINPKELAKIEITGSDILLVLPNGLRFIWCPEDFRTAASHVVNDGGYESKERAVLFNLVSKAKTIFDIGANIGWYALHFAQLVKEKRGQVYAFEPVKDTFEVLTKNVRLNHGVNIHPFNNAFGNKKGIINFYVPLSGSGAASMRPLYESKLQEVECNVLRLDDFVADQGIEKIDFLKCDVEGAELLVVNGGLDTLKNHRPIIFMEMLRKWSAKFGYHPNEIIGIFQNIEYNSYFSECERLIRLEKIDDDCMETNFYFLHKEIHQDIIKELVL